MLQDLYLYEGYRIRGDVQKSFNGLNNLKGIRQVKFLEKLRRLNLESSVCVREREIEELPRIF